MALEKKKGKRSPIKAPMQLVQAFGSFVPPVGTGPITGSNDVLYGCNVTKLATDHTYEVTYDFPGKPTVTPVFVDYRTTHSSSLPGWRVDELRRSTSGSQFVLTSSLVTPASNNYAPNFVSFAVTLKVGD